MKHGRRLKIAFLHSALLHACITAPVSGYPIAMHAAGILHCQRHRQLMITVCLPALLRVCSDSPWLQDLQRQHHTVRCRLLPCRLEAPQPGNKLRLVRPERVCRHNRPSEGVQPDRPHLIPLHFHYIYL